MASIIILVVSISTGGGVLELISALTGVIGAILIAKGKISGYFHGMIATASYGYIAYVYELIGESIVYFLIFLPMQFIGWWLWFNRSGVDSANQEIVTVVMKKLSLKGIIYLVIASIATIFIYAQLIKLYGGYQPSLDSATSILSIIATALMVLGYREQWHIWIITNIVAIILWIQAVIHNNNEGAAILAMWIVYLLNSAYGLYKWNKGSQ